MAKTTGLTGEQCGRLAATCDSCPKLRDDAIFGLTSTCDREEAGTVSTCPRLLRAHRAKSEMRETVRQMMDDFDRAQAGA